MDKNHIKKFIASKYEAFISDRFYQIKEEKIQLTDSETYLINDFVVVDGELEEGDVEFAERPIEVSVNFGEFVFGSFMFRKSNKVDYLIHKENKLQLEFFDMLMDDLIQIKETTNSLHRNQKNSNIDNNKNYLKLHFNEVFSSISIITEYSQQTIFNQIDSIFAHYFEEELKQSLLQSDAKSKIPFNLNQDKVGTLLAMLHSAGYFECSRKVLANHFTEYFSYKPVVGRSQENKPELFKNLYGTINKAISSIHDQYGSFHDNKMKILERLS